MASKSDMPQANKENGAGEQEKNKTQPNMIIDAESLIPFTNAEEERDCMDSIDHILYDREYTPTKDELKNHYRVEFTKNELKYHSKVKVQLRVGSEFRGSINGKGGFVEELQLCLKKLEKLFNEYDISFHRTKLQNASELVQILDEGILQSGKQKYRKLILYQLASIAALTFYYSQAKTLHGLQRKKITKKITAIDTMLRLNMLSGSRWASYRYWKRVRSILSAERDSLKRTSQYVIFQSHLRVLKEYLPPKKIRDMVSSIFYFFDKQHEIYDLAKNANFKAVQYRKEQNLRKHIDALTPTGERKWEKKILL